MRKVLYLAVLVMGLLAVAAPASAVIHDDGAPPTTPGLTPHTFTVQLQPSGDPEGSGTAELIVDLGRGTVCYDITVTGIGAPTEPLHPEQYYVNVHTVEFPGGAVQGDLA
jgi:hypothetical protein